MVKWPLCRECIFAVCVIRQCGRALDPCSSAIMSRSYGIRSYCTMHVSAPMYGIAHKRQHRHKFTVATRHHFETQSNQYPCAPPSLSYSGTTPSPVGVSQPACEATPRNSCRLVPHSTSPHRGACDLILRGLIHCTHAISQPKNRRPDRGARFGNK